MTTITVDTLYEMYLEAEKVKPKYLYVLFKEDGSVFYQTDIELKSGDIIRV